MAEENENGNGNGEATEDGGVLELTRDELRTMIQEEAEKLAAPIRTDLEAAREELDAERSSAHEVRVREVARQLQDAGHSAAVTTRVAEIMLADTGGVELTLSRREDDGSVSEVKETVSDLILSVLEVVRTEDLELTKRQPESRPGQKPPARQEDDRPLDERAKEILDDVREKAVMISGI